MVPFMLARCLQAHHFLREGISSPPSEEVRKLDDGASGLEQGDSRRRRNEADDDASGAQGTLLLHGATHLRKLATGSLDDDTDDDAVDAAAAA